MEATAVLAGAYTHHLKFLSPDPQALATFYSNVMDMKLDRIGDETVREAFAADAETWLEAAL